MHDELKRRVNTLFTGKHIFTGIHIFSLSNDIPDDCGNGPRLVVLSPSDGYSKNDSSSALVIAEKILQSRGEQPRQKRNRLLFLAADMDTVSRLNDTARTYLAWQDIRNDINEGKLNLDLFQVNSAKKQFEIAEKSLIQVVRESYKWLLCPTQNNPSNHIIDWESVSLSTNAPNFVQEIETRLREEEWLITDWSPIHLKNLLDQWYFKDGIKDVSALKVFQDTCHYLYMPRLINEKVYQNTISQGIKTEDYFAFASGKEEDKYLGFLFGKEELLNLDSTCILIDVVEARNYQKKIRVLSDYELEGIIDESNNSDNNVPYPPLNNDDSSQTDVGTNTIQLIQVIAKKRFYGEAQIDPIKAKIDFANIVDEIIQQFTIKLGVDVSISVEIVAKSNDGFDEILQRTIRENCQVLKFSTCEFEED